jgi:hypothetical protein
MFRKKSLFLSFSCISAFLAIIAIVSSVASPHALAQPTEVALAGFAYSGDAQSIATRFPYSVRYEKQLKSKSDSINARIRKDVGGVKIEHVTIVPQLDSLRGRDQAIATALVLTSETVSVEEFGNLRKLFVLLRGQAMFFDFKSMTVVRSYPISFAYIDVLDRKPTEDEILEKVRFVFEGAGGKPGLISRFSANLARVSFPKTVPRFLQVSKVSISSDARSFLPAYVNSSSAVSEAWFADIVSEAISTRAGVPIIPYAKGYAVGNVMSMRIADGDVFNLTLPKPDYEITADLTNFKKVKFGESGAGVSFVYGAFANIKIEEPLSGKSFLSSPLKNGETKVVPSTQSFVDDFPAYYDAINHLFVKLAETIDGKNTAQSDWIKSASPQNDIEKQIAATRELFSKCK